MNTMKRQNDRTLKEELPRSVGAQYATGDQWRNNSRKNEGMEPKQKECPAVDATGDRSKVQRCKEQCCIGTWNVRSMNQGKLEVVKQEVARGHQRADTLKPYSQKTSQSNHTRTTALSNSTKLSHARGATQDGRVMVERSDRMWSTGEGNGKPLQ